MSLQSLIKTFALISMCTGSLAAHSERSRQRSGPIRSVPVAADIKRDADFDCPEEFGYYPHPEDCTLYYVCVFGGALLESCTGGLMYSHELQTCDWPRNVGCDVTGASAVGGDVERYNEREPPPPPPPRRAPAPPPPPPRAQPKPVITSRGQPKSQELLYSEVDDLPPIEEIESDRQQRVYRGQPSTIGQVQRDRDGYSSQINSGRNINSNIIPASISQGNGKIGSFSFGTQVDDRRTVINDRRTASITQAPQTYSLEPTESLTPVSYSASPRPKMLYNGSQNYTPEQYDPYYAIYDEDGELYKDTDYVQQYNTASVRPAVQQTYRGTPPPARRPAAANTPRPSTADDYDDALIQGQINTQSQYQTAVRQSTRGDGNELGYDHNPSSVRTTLYEATTKSTTPPTTTSTSTTTTTTPRPTTAPFTEAMTPSRYTQRSSTDANQVPDLDFQSLPFANTSPRSFLNISTFAKPFEKTNNSMRLRDALLPITDKTDTSTSQGISSLSYTQRHPYCFEKQPEDNVYEKEKKNAVSFTTGFSIRRDGNDDNNNTYTLTVITRPFQNSDGNNSKTEGLKTNHQTKINRFYYKTEDEGYVNPTRKRVDKTLLESDEKYTQAPLIRRTDSQSVYNAREDDFPRNLNLKQSNTREQKNKRRRIKNYVSTTTVSSTTVDDSNVHKYYLKTVLRRPAPFSTDNSGNPHNFVEKTLEDTRNNDFTDNQEIPEILQEFSEEKDFTIKKNSEQRELPVSPYKSLNNLRNDYIIQRRPQQDFPTTRSYYNFSNKEESYKNNREVTTQNLRRRNENNYIEGTTEVFSTATQRLINVLLNNFTNASNQVTSSYPRTYVTTTSTTTTSVPPVNIADYKQTSKYNDDYSISKTNFRTLETTSEKHLQEKVHSQLEIDSSAPLVEKSEKSPHIFDDSRNPFVSRDNYENEKDNITNLDFNEPQYIVNTEIKKDALASINQKTKELSNPVLIDYNDKEVDISYNKIDYEAAKPVEPFISTPSKDDLKPDFDDNTDLTTSTENFRLATTELTTRSTITTTTTLKSISFPTRPSRVNPAIKMAAANPGGGRRSYQSSKCSSDNSLQANPKCNEIKYQRYISILVENQSRSARKHNEFSQLLTH